MAIRLSFIDFIVRIETIREKYPGGWEQCLKDHEPLLGGKCWYDEHLFHDGAMNSMDIKAIADRWEAMGFEPVEEVDGRQVFKDVCVVGGFLLSPTLPCDWLEIQGGEQPHGWLRGTEPGPIAGLKGWRPGG